MKPHPFHNRHSDGVCDTCGVYQRWLIDGGTCLGPSDPVQLPNPDAPDETEPMYADDDPGPVGT